MAESVLLGQTAVYEAAVQALYELKHKQQGMSPEVRVLAQFLLFAYDARLPERAIRYVGDPKDARDRAVVQAYQEQLRFLVAGEDED